MKVSLVIPVYFNELNLRDLYADIQKNFIAKIDYDYEIVMVDDGSGDQSYEIMQDIAKQDPVHIKTIRLSRNFGAHAAILCGISHCTGDCAVIKMADLQEPTEIVIQMVEKWKEGNKVVLAVREGRDESKRRIFFANLYYKIVQKVALPQMPEQGFDVYLIDRKVITVLENLDEKNSALTGQILWSGFKTAEIKYRRLACTAGESRWTLKKKIRLVMDTLFSFTSLPITVVLLLGTTAVALSVIAAIYVLIDKMQGGIPVRGWTTLFIFQLFSFGVIMMTLGILGEYLWRTFDASRRRPVYIVEESSAEKQQTEK